MFLRDFVLQSIVSVIIILSRSQYVHNRRVGQFWEKLTQTDTFWSSLEKSPQHVISRNFNGQQDYIPSATFWNILNNSPQTTTSRISHNNFPQSLPLQKFKPNIRKRQTVKKRNRSRNRNTSSAPQVLMTECPLNTRCVSRNFCDNNGMVTESKHNTLVFENDRRGFIACVDSEKNVLGVCCVDLAVMLAGAGRPVRQDDVFNVETSVDLDQEATSSVGSTPGPFVIINIAADNADIDGQVTSDPRVQTNVNTRRPNTRPTPPPGFLDDNPFISNPNQNNNDNNVNLSPSDVMAILNIMNDNRQAANNNNNRVVNNFAPTNTPVFTTCPAATLCVDRSRCTTTGVSLRNRRQSTNKVCCRDPNKIRKDYDDDEDDDYDFDNFDIEYEDMDKIFMYNMKTTYDNDKEESKSPEKSEKLKRRKKKRKKSRPLTVLEVPENTTQKKNRDTLDFFTNG